MLDAVREWVKVLIITAFIGGVATVIMPASGDKTAKYIKFAGSLIAAAIMLAPVSGLLRYLPSASLGLPPGFYTQSAHAAEPAGSTFVLDIIVNELEFEISNMIYENLSIIPSEININIKQDNIIPGEKTIEYIEVYIQTSEIHEELSADCIKKRLNEILGMEINVIIIDY